MIKKVLIFIIVFTVFYEIYLLYLEKPNENNNKNIELPKIEKIEEKIKPLANKLFSYINEDDEIYNNEDDEIYNNEDDEIYNNELIDIDPNMFGKPTEYKKNNIIVWTPLEPKPWNKIVYKYNEKFPFYFHIKIKVPSLNDYSNWKKIISNLDFDPKSGEIIIPTEDEETALSIANLIISNFKGDLSLEDIINKNLIDVSINKAKKYEIVKNKLIEQIMSNINNKSTETFDETQTFTTDLAKTNNDFTAYEGIEYSFF